ncbi:MAG: hypothetical protein M9921_14195 [Fimbriimonadaceae bacterium]|nr:hypothetical protein [Fimbriimonadaceae bacterium]
MLGILALLPWLTSFPVATFPFSWLDHGGARWSAVVRVSISEALQVFTTVAVRRNDALLWEARIDGLSERMPDLVIAASLPSFVAQSSALAFPVVSGQRLLLIDVPVPNWSRTLLWVVGEGETEPLVLSRRDEWKNVVALHRSDGLVDELTLYDRWVGGVQSETRIRGKLFSRTEQVSEYRVGARGFELKRERKRLVPNSGGGIGEKDFVWISPGHQEPPAPPDDRCSTRVIAGLERTTNVTAK